MPGTFGLAPGTVESGSRYFPIPSLGANWMLGEEASLGISLHGNGGMNTDYQAPAQTFGFAPTGVDYAQLFVAPTYARKLGGKHAVGVTGILSYQRFEAKGLRAFSAFSSDPAQLTDNEHANSLGYGARVGYLGVWSPYFSVGASYQSKIKMGAFDSYAGLFAGRGDLDTPATWTAGVAIKPTDRLAFLVDVQQILYDGVDSIHNPLHVPHEDVFRGRGQVGLHDQHGHAGLDPGRAQGPDPRRRGAPLGMSAKGPRRSERGS